MYNPLEVFRFIAEAQTRGERTALVTIIDVTGASTRNPGAHLAVSETGAFAGSLSGGCIERAVAGEAIDAIMEGVPRTVRFGQGSPYIDIRLPCGGGVDLLCTPIGDASNGRQLVTHLEARCPLTLGLSLTAPGIAILDEPANRALTVQKDLVLVGHVPPLRLAIFGNGAAVIKLAELAGACEAIAEVYSPDERIVAASLELGAPAKLLKTLTGGPYPELDRWTAVVVLFHDHDWEPAYIAHALASEAFYVGAMGSNRTHAARCGMLRQMGIAEVDIARIVAPIGLIPSMRDPETLAVSILAQVVAEFDRRHLKPDQKPGSRSREEVAKNG